MPCDYSKYPKDWKAIRARILEREGHKCKTCGVANYSFRNKSTGEVLSPAQYAVKSGYALWQDSAWSKIVLTIAHLHDPDPMNCADDNLAALCQQCHNRLDMPMRQSNARQTRARKAGQVVMFDERGQLAGVIV